MKEADEGNLGAVMLMQRFGLAKNFSAHPRCLTRDEVYWGREASSC